MYTVFFVLRPFLTHNFNSYFHRFPPEFDFSDDLSVVYYKFLEDGLTNAKVHQL